MASNSTNIQGGHADVVFRYTITAIILAVLTALEILILFPPLEDWSLVVKIALLAVLGVGKFILVVALFMHLWDDPFLYTGLFGLGMVIGLGTVAALLLLMPRNPNPIDPYDYESPEYLRYQKMMEKQHKDSGEEQHHAQFSAGLIELG